MRKTRTRDKIAIMGFHEGNAGQIAEWIEETTGGRLAAFFEEGDGPLRIDAVAENAKRVSQRMEYPAAGRYKGRPFFHCRDWPERLRKLGVRRVVPVASDNLKRRGGIRRCLAEGFELLSAIHPSALILERAVVEPGVWIHAGAIVGYKAEIQAGAMINTGAQIDHHAILEACSQVDPGVVTASHVTLRALSHVHTGATIINRITVGAEAIVGAGAVVIEDVPPRCTVAGVPARVIKRR